jgi:hypothetical protein
MSDLIRANAPWPTIAELAAKYSTLTPEEKRKIDERIETLTDAEITAMRTIDLKHLLGAVQVQLLEASFKKSRMSRDGETFWTTLEPIVPGLELAALSWYKINEFWLTVAEDSSV